MNHYDDRTEALLEERFHVLDVLPRQVSAERGAAWFAAERWLLQRPRLEALYARFASVLIRLSCYYDLAVTDGGAWLDRPEPEELEARLARCVDGGWLNILLPGEDALFTLSGGDVYMTLYHASPALADTAAQLAAAEGLFLRPGD